MTYIFIISIHKLQKGTLYEMILLGRLTMIATIYYLFFTFKQLLNRKVTLFMLTLKMPVPALVHLQANVKRSTNTAPAAGEHR